MLLPSCNDVLGDIYDKPVDSPEYGFIEPCTASAPGRIYVNASDYTVWNYITFEDRHIDSLSVYGPQPAKWDIAIHRYDAKTNNARVVETGLSDIVQALTWEKAPDDVEVADIWTTNQIVTDMSTMMDGYLSYAESYYNAELSKWLNVDTGTMPPVYTPSDRVYIIYLENGMRAAVRLADYMNSAGVKGYMSLQYIYPL